MNENFILVELRRAALKLMQQLEEIFQWVMIFGQVRNLDC